MHELSVTENILNVALEYARKESAVKVTDINLEIGQMSSIIDDSVQFYWEMIARDTICEEAKLNFHRIPAKFTCLACGKEYLLGSEPGPCPTCGSYNVRLVSGDEFRLESIQIEK